MTSTPVSHTPPRKASKMPSTQNLNHLLNFTLPPRQPRPFQSLPRRSRKTATNQGVWNKERYINAQYRFVMNPTGDYTAHFADPDIFFQWEDILQVITPRSSVLASATTNRELSSQLEGLTTCPICLSPPTAPRMTKCGHVFCFPCILRYLSTSGHNKWARCPICFDSVNERQLKSVKWYEEPGNQNLRTTVRETSQTSPETLSLEGTPRTVQLMRMRLMQRPQITTLALPRSATWPSDLLPPHQAPWYFLPDVFSHAKFMLATPEYLMADLSTDLQELENERRTLTGMNDELGMLFVDAADQRIRDQIAKASALENTQLLEQIEKARRDQHEVEVRALVQNERKRREEASASTEERPEELLALRSRSNGINVPFKHTASASKSQSAAMTSHNCNGQKARRNVNPPPPTTSTYYYYQAASGLPLFLHPLDIRILHSHFNEYASFPDTIDICIEAFSEGTVNDDLRKRCKYLAHLPEGADVVFIEADLENVVGAEGLKNFEGPLKIRNSRRKDKERKDDRARTRAEERERDKERLWTRSAVYSSSLPFGAAQEIANEAFQRFVIDDSPPNGDRSGEGVVFETSQQPQPATITGAWGNRSFASALHAAPPPRASIPTSRTPARAEEEDWDVEGAWHELEQRSSGRKKRSNKLVVLGSGGGGRRR